MKKLLTLLLSIAVILTSTITVFADGSNSFGITNGTPESAKETNHGYIAIDKETVAEEETVTITVNPAEGYQLKSLTVAPTGFVDLGIKDAEGKPLCWKETNLGANNPQDPGDYYMWGATALMYSNVDRSKTDGAFTFVTQNPYGDNYKNTWDASLGFNWNNIPFASNVFISNSRKNVFTKYTTSLDYAENSTPDGFVTLKPEDDAATAENENWRMPTKNEFVVLATNCVLIWTDNYNSTGNAGYIVYKAKNDTDKGKTNMNGTWKMWDAANSKYIANTGSEPTGYSTSDIHIFLPAAGYGSTTQLKSFNEYCTYWESSLDSDFNHKAYSLSLSASTGSPQGSNDRRNAYSIRPVMSDPGITPAKQTDGKYQFTMPGYAVTVTAEFGVTIAGVLAMSEETFPTTNLSGWVNHTGKKAYVDENENLLVATHGYKITELVTKKDDGNYEFKTGNSNECIFTFVMESNKLVKITATGFEDDRDGDYSPYKFINDPISVPVGYTGNLLFMTYANFNNMPEYVEVYIKLQGQSEELLDTSNYILEKGSTKVTLIGNYVKTLPSGTHSIKICVAGYDDIAQDFIITAAPSPSSDPTPRYKAPNTGVE